MKSRQIVIDYEEYAAIEEMSRDDRELAEAAIEARNTAYSPYSHFQVGAAVRLDNGTIVKGSNQENAAYPSGLCAERTAMYWANANYPGVPMISIAIAGGPRDENLCDSPTTPCGACRQAMAEYQKIGGKTMSIILVGGAKTLKFNKVEDILPLIFDSI